MAIALVNLVMIPWYWIVPESPRWLLAAGRFAESEKIMRKAANRNRADRDPNFETEFRDRWEKVVRAFAAKIVYNEDGSERKISLWSTVKEILHQVKFELFIEDKKVKMSKNLFIEDKKGRKHQFL